MKQQSRIVGGIAALAGLVRGSGQESGTFECRHPAYKPHIISTSPLVVYISDFVTAQEREHLRQVT